jgi:hypothetical protein
VEALRQAFQDLLGQAQELRVRHAGEIERQSRGLDPSQILRTIREQ